MHWAGESGHSCLFLILQRKHSCFIIRYYVSYCVFFLHRFCFPSWKLPFTPLLLRSYIMIIAGIYLFLFSTNWNAVRDWVLLLLLLSIDMMNYIDWLIFKILNQPFIPRVHLPWSCCIIILCAYCWWEVGCSLHGRREGC